MGGLRRLLLLPTAVVILAALGLAQARSSDGSGEQSRTPPTYFKDVRPILQGRCAGCHRIGEIAPFKLTTYADAFKHRREMARAVKARLMPPWLAEAGHRKYRYDFSLTTAQIGIIDRWVRGGARRGNAARPGRRIAPVKFPTFGRGDVVTGMPASYTPRAGTDDYRCFLLPWAPDRARYVTAFRATPGQASAVHHLAVFIMGPEDSATAERFEAEDAKTGYPCYGSTGVLTGSETGQPLGGWLPGGGGGSAFPAGTGIYIQPGQRLLLQVHYNTEHTVARPDRTQIALMLSDSVPRRATPVNATGPPSRLRIPPGDKNYVYEFDADISTSPSFTRAGLDITRGYLLHAVALHMHLLGTHGTAVLIRANGRSETLLSIPRWRFHWQSAYHFDRPIHVMPGDVVRVTCHYDNSAANQPVLHGVRRPPRLVTWGIKSEDEMCTSFLYASEL